MRERMRGLSRQRALVRVDRTLRLDLQHRDEHLRVASPRIVIAQ
jgi:hypothetical protein